MYLYKKKTAEEKIRNLKRKSMETTKPEAQRKIV